MMCCNPGRPWVGSRLANSVGENFRPQAAACAIISPRPARDDRIHPVTPAAFGGSQNTHALDFKCHADERIQIRVRRDDVAPRDAGRLAADAELAAKLFKNFRRKKGDLTLVVVLEIKEAVALDAGSGHTADFCALDQRMFARRQSLAAKKIMARRNVKVTDFHGGNMTIISGGGNSFAHGVLPER